MSPTQDASSTQIKVCPPDMTASAINIASMAPNAQPGAGAAANAAGGGNGLAGFEALLGALFPQADPTAAGQPGAPLAGMPVNPDALVDGAKTDDTAADTAPDAATDGQPTVGDAAAALAASLLAAQPASAETQVTAPKDGAATPPAWGRDKAKGAPAMPAILNANPKAGLAEKAELAAAAADEAQPAVETAPAGDLNPAAPAPSAKPAPPPAAAAPQQAPAAPTLEKPDTSPAPPLLADAPVEPTPYEAIPPAVTAASLASRGEAAPAPVAPAKPAKAERAKSAVDASEPTSDVGKPLEAADKPAGPKPAQGAAKSSDAAIEAADAKAEDTRAAPESPDAPLQGETRAANQTAAPASAHATHAVRGSPETVANLAAQIVKKLEGKTTRFDVELDPHGLGKVDVRIEIGAQGRITAGMVFDNPQAAADVKARAAELQRALEQAGFDITGGMSFDVAQDRGQQQQNQAWQDQGETGRAFRGQAFRAALETAGDAADAANQGALRLRRGVNAGLDVRI